MVQVRLYGQFTPAKRQREDGNFLRLFVLATWLLGAIFVAIVCWVGIGVGVGGVLGVFGARGAAILAAVASSLAVVCRALGMGRAAAFFALRA